LEIEMEMGVEQESGENKEIGEKGNKGIRQKEVGSNRPPSERSASPYSLIPLFPFSLFLLLGLAFAMGVLIGRGSAREAPVPAVAAMPGDAAVALTARQSAVGEALAVEEELVSPTDEEPQAVGSRMQADVGEASVCRFSGAARIKLGPAPAGTRVEAWVEGVRVAETQVVVEGEESLYTFTLDGRYAGKTVEFRFPEYPQFPPAGYAVCEPGQEQKLALEGRTLGGCGGGG